MKDTSRDLLTAIDRAVAAANDPLDRAAAAVRAANAELEAAVAEARRHNVPWTKIADLVGMRSQQAARQKYGRLEPDHRRQIKTWACPLPDPRRPDLACQTKATYRHSVLQAPTRHPCVRGHELTGDEAERVLDDLEEYGMIPTKPIYTEDSGGRGEAQDIDGPRGHVLVRCRSDRGHGARPDRDLRPRVPDG